MRRLDWFLAAVIGTFLVACVAAMALSQTVADVAGGATAARQSFAERVVSPTGDPISVRARTLLQRR